MKPELPLAFLKAEQKASEIIDRFGITSPEHIRLEDISYLLGAQTIVGPLIGAAASLVRWGRCATIRVCDNEEYEPRKRFSIAHELGHFILGHGYSIPLVCSASDMLNNQPGQEAEANHFAAELLLPKKLFKDRCDVKEVTFAPVQKLAEEFATSRTATAIRFVRFCPKPCAFIFTWQSKILWFYKSEAWWPFIRKEQDLDNGSMAYNFFHGKELPNEPREVNGKAWVSSPKVGSIVEHSIPSHNPGYVLTILWLRP
jgi:hypothetical protein